MARIIEDKKEVTVYDFHNDWVLVAGDETPLQKINPTSLEYSEEEIERIQESKEKGIFSVLFQWNGNRLIRKPKTVAV